MKWLTMILLLMCTGSGIHAGVDLRHGTFYMSYTDIDFPDTRASISRSYNSNNTGTGLFGYGWSSFIETKLTALPDGTLSLSWWGGGLGDYYEPAVTDRKGLYYMIDVIVKDLISNKKLENDPVAIAEKRSYYFINNKQRAEKYIALVKKKAVPAFIPPTGRRLTWILDVNQTILWNGKTFEVKSWRDSYLFNQKGQLVTINDEGYKMELQYSGNGLSAIIVNDSNTCHVKTAPGGLITGLSFIKNGKSHTASYYYDSSNNLVYSKDAGDNEYRYSYDLYHNLTRISYTDNTFMEMTYDAASNRIIKIKDRKGASVTYQYPYFYTADGKINDDHYATRVKQYDSTGKLFFTQYKEYENRRRDDGSSYQHRVFEQTDTSFHEALYDPEVQNAFYRKKNDRIAWASYDSKHRPSYLRLADSIYRSRYNVAGLPEYFAVIDSLKKDSITYQYVYNEEEQLVEVKKNNRVYTIFNPPGKDFKVISLGDTSIEIHFKEGKPANIKAGKWGSYTLAELNAANIENTGLLQPEELTNRKKIWDIYKEFSDATEVKHIAHEWIWQRL